MSAIMDTLTAKGLKLRRDGDRLIVTPKSALTDDLLVVVRDHKTELLDELDDALPDARMEERRQNVMSQLSDNPNIVRAILVDDRADPDDVIVAVAVRDLASFELRIPRNRFDLERFMGLVDKHSVRPAAELVAPLGGIPEKETT